jgi:hypothetical protein
MRLWEINQQIEKAIELGFDPETGEILDDSALRELEIARDEKIENICLYIKDLKAEADAIKAEKATMDARMKAATRKADSLSTYLQTMLAGEKFKTARCAVSYRKTQSVQITDQDQIPDIYIRRKVVEEPDKVAIKEALKAGGEIAGAYLEERQSMTIK